MCLSHSVIVPFKGLPGSRGTSGLPGSPGVDVSPVNQPLHYCKFMHHNNKAAVLYYLCQGPRGPDGYKGEQGRPGVPVRRSNTMRQISSKFITMEANLFKTSLYFQGERGLPGLAGAPGQQGEKVTCHDILQCCIFVTVNVHENTLG